MKIFTTLPLAFTPFAAARSQMTLSLVFHIIFAAIGIGLPLMMVISEYHYLKTGKEHFKRLTHQWAKATGLLFVIGAVSGTALSFELGLLWPTYMQITGAAVGHLFALEGFAFFIEAIFIGLYLYAEHRLTPRAHWWCGVVIATSGMISGILVLGVNAWMQLPVGVTLDAHNVVTGTQPLAIFATRAWWTMALHSTLASYISVGFAIAGIYALKILRGRNDDFNRSAIRIGIVVGGICAILQMVSGDLIARFVADTQPAKFAAMESHFVTESHAPIILGGFPDLTTETVHGAIQIPDMLSFLADHDFNYVVKGLHDIPRSDWPNIAVTHFAFDIMVGSGSLLALVAAISIFLWWKQGDRWFSHRWLMRITVLCGFLGFIALEAGWVVTEAGRQPWVIHNILRTSDAVTTAPHVIPIFFAYAALYFTLGITCVMLLRTLSAEKPPHGPHITAPHDAPTEVKHV